VETLKAYKQIISHIKTQNWPMYWKLKVQDYILYYFILDSLVFAWCVQILRRAKRYIKRHEGELKQSKQAKNIMAKYGGYLEKVIKMLAYVDCIVIM